MSNPAFQQLRETIRQCGKQFRLNDDNSPSLFHPKKGFVYGYDVSRVEKALDVYEASMPTDFSDEYIHLTMEDKILSMARTIVATHEEMDIRDFARTVTAYLVLNDKPEKRISPLKGLRIVDNVDPSEED